MFLFICSLIHGCSVACCSRPQICEAFFFQFSSCNQFLVSYHCGWKSAWCDFIFLTLRIFLWLNIWSNLSNVLWAFGKIMYVVTFALLWLFSTKLYLTLCNPKNCSTPGFPVHHYLPEFAQTHVHWVGNAIQPSHPLSPHSPPALNLSHHLGLFNDSALHIRWPKYMSFRFSISPSNEY